MGMLSIDPVRTAEAFEGIGILLNVVALDAELGTWGRRGYLLMGVLGQPVLGSIGDQMQALAGRTFPPAGACKGALANVLEKQHLLDATECQQTLGIELEYPSPVR